MQDAQSDIPIADPQTRVGFSPIIATPLMKWAHHPNLRKRPRTPANGRGSVQRAIRRAFAASGTEALTSSVIYDRAHIRRRLGRRKSMPFGVYSRTLRTLRAMCDPIERVPQPGDERVGDWAHAVL